MTWYRVGPAGIPGSLKTDMDAVLNKKFGTSTTYAPNTWPDNVNLLGPLPEKTASGAIANITDGADGVPLKNWLVTLPASLDGYTEVNGVRTGKNLFDGYTKGYGVNSSTGAIVTTSAGAISGYIPIKEAVNYYLSGITDTLRSFIAFYKSDKTFISRTNGNDKTFLSFTPPSESAFVIVYQYQVSSSTGTIDDVDNMQTQLEVGSSASSYEPYTEPTQYTASLGRTIYGGSVDIVTGEGEDENGNAFTFTPITPTPETALGVNNFWADEGDSDVTYRADISLALQALGGGGRGLMGMMMQRPEEEQLTETEEDPEEQPEEAETNER